VRLDGEVVSVDDSGQLDHELVFLLDREHAVLHPVEILGISPRIRLYCAVE